MPSAPNADKMDVDTSNGGSDDYDFDSTLKVYYQKFFPHKEMFQWLSYGSSEREYFINREFSFTLKGDIYTRYRSFNDLDHFSKELKKVNPHKIDIGAVYTTAPRNREMYGKSFLPKEKELVFDIDMTDYDDVRQCCSDANICNKCWVLMAIAIRVIHRILTTEFGFRNILWVYSGRRGIHCWVCDSRARKLSAEARKAIAEYITVIAGGEGKQRKLNFGSNLHPSLRKSYEQVLLPGFEERILIDQKVLATKENQEKVLSFIPDEKIRQELRDKWEDRDEYLDMWAEFKDAVQRIVGKTVKDVNPIYDVVFTYTYPRLDVNVSTGLNHLLKSPFCVHPKTGRVCVPMDPEHPEEFNPEKVPTLGSLIKQYDSYSAPDSQSKPLKDFKRTDMKEHVAFFKKAFLRHLQNDIRKEALEREQQADTKVIDF